VVAGLAPLNPSLLQLVPPELASLYITAYNMGFITDPKFVTGVPPLSCSSGPNCTSIFLPGGLDLVRLQGQNPNATLFGSNLPGDYTTIVIENAPGAHLEFSSLGAGFVSTLQSAGYTENQSMTASTSVLLKMDLQW
jgi:hypothetical protein